jgi:hypothetical protein
MNYVVKASGRTEYPMWLSAPGLDACRTLVRRKSAQVFSDYAEASAAIAQMPREFEASGIAFSIEPAP